MSTNKLIYIEQGALNTDVAALFTARTVRDSTLFIPSRHHLDAFDRCLRERFPGLDPVFVTYSTVDAGIDEWLYSSAMEVASRYFALFQSSSRMVTGQRNSVIPGVLVDPLTVALHDRLVAVFRPLVCLRDHCLSHGIDRIEMFPGPGCRTAAVSEFFARNGITVDLRTDHLRPEQMAPYQRGNAAAVRFTNAPVGLGFVYSLARREPVGRAARAFVVSNLTTTQYKYTILPVIGKLLEDYCLDVFCISPDPTRDGIDEFCLDSVANGRLRLLSKKRSARRGRLSDIHAACAEIANSAMRRLIIPLGQHADASLAALSGVVADSLVRLLPRLLLNAHQYERCVRSRVMTSDAVIVSPGRTLEAGIAVAIASRAAIPTYEIQTGTMAHSKRFVSPRTDVVFCIDDASLRVYSDTLSVPVERLCVVGSPRIDYALRDCRRRTRADALRSLFGSDGTDSSKQFLLFVGQPVGVEAMLNALQTVLQSIEGDSRYCLLIKPHPNEGAEYLRAYHAMLDRYPVDAVMLAATDPIHDCIIVSGLVIVYFSTVGIEAYCLDRKVVTINPLDTPPPFDLAELGLATPVATSMALRDVLERLADTDQSAPEHVVLKDGRSVERIQEFVRKRVDSRQVSLRASFVRRVRLLSHNLSRHYWRLLG